MAWTSFLFLSALGHNFDAKPKQLYVFIIAMSLPETSFEAYPFFCVEPIM